MLSGAPPAPDTAGGRRRGFRFRRGGPSAKPGTYHVTLIVDGERHTHPLQVEIDPDQPDATYLEYEEEELEEEEEEGGEEGQ